MKDYSFDAQNLIKDLVDCHAICNPTSGLKTALVTGISEFIGAAVGFYTVPGGIEKPQPLFNETANSIIRLLNESRVLYEFDRQAKGAIQEFIRWHIQTKCETAARAKELVDRCRQLQETG